MGGEGGEYKLITVKMGLDLQSRAAQTSGKILFRTYVKKVN